MTTKKNPYPLFIILLISCFLGFSVWSAMQAIDAGPEVTDADYYSKGLKYSSTVLEKRAAAVLGWKVETQLIGKARRNSQWRYFSLPGRVNSEQTAALTGD